MAVREKNGRYIIDYYPNGTQGRRVVFTTPLGTTQDQASSIEQELRSRKKEHNHATPSGNISHLIPHYIRYSLMHQSPETTRDKRSFYSVHLLPYFGHMHISDISNSHIMAFKEYLKEKHLSNRTISKGLCYFSAFVKWAEEELNMSTPIPLRFKRLPHTRAVPIVLSINEVLAFLTAVDRPYQALFKIFFYLGLRNRAGRLLRWEDVDWANRSIKTTEKGGKVKWHPIPDDLLSDLRGLYIETKSPWIFPSSKNLNKPIVKLNKIIAHARQKAGISKRIYPHLLRHSIATHLLDSDVDIRQIQAFLGHAQISTTEWYAQVSMEKKRQALEKAGFKTTKT